MSWLLVGAAALAGLVLVVVGIGAALPRDHVASRAALLPAPPERVWALLTDVAAYPRWRGDVRAVELLPARDAEGRTTWRETSRHGTITFEITDADPPRRLVSRIVDTGLPFGGAWEYALVPDGGGTRLTVTERGAVHNPLFRFVSRFVMGHTATIDAYLRALGRALGSDDVPLAAVLHVTGGSHGA